MVGVGLPLVVCGGLTSHLGQAKEVGWAFQGSTSTLWVAERPAVAVVADRVGAGPDGTETSHEDERGGKNREWTAVGAWSACVPS